MEIRHIWFSCPTVLMCANRCTQTNDSSNALSLEKQFDDPVQWRVTPRAPGERLEFDDSHILSLEESEARALLRRRIDAFPRIHLAHLPTPLEFLPRLTKALGGPRIYIKRDNQTGLATGGNKTRKLEFVMADAVAHKATHIITQGATQTNHGRQTAAAAAKLGLKSYVLYENRRMSQDRAYLESSNVFLCRLLGAKVKHYDAGTNMDAEMEKLAEKVRKEGGRPYIVPGGASVPRGSLGYVNCALELLDQADEQGIHIDHLVTSTGSGGTHAGLVTGMRAAKSSVPVLGVGTRAPKKKQEEMVFKLAQETSAFLGYPESIVARSDVVANCNYVGEGYGEPAPSTIEAIQMLAELEAILLDPVYSGKGMAGLIDLCRKGRFKPDENVVFVHTGGEAALFAYAQHVELPPLLSHL